MISLLGNCQPRLQLSCREFSHLRRFGARSFVALIGAVKAGTSETNSRVRRLRWKGVFAAAAANDENSHRVK